MNDDDGTRESLICGFKVGVDKYSTRMESSANSCSDDDDEDKDMTAVSALRSNKTACAPPCKGPPPTEDKAGVPTKVASVPPLLCNDENNCASVVVVGLDGCLLASFAVVNLQYAFIKGHPYEETRKLPIMDKLLRNLM